MLRKTLITTFDDRRGAERALRRLVDAGFDREELQLFTAEDRAHRASGLRGPMSITGANTGAAWGGVVGALTSLGIAVGSLDAAQVGLMAVVPILAAALGAGVGGAAGSLIGALVSAGVSEPQAHAAQEALRRGNVLVAVSTELGLLARAKAILRGAGGVGIHAFRSGHAPHHA